jgi:copper chaperone CopZ
MSPATIELTVPDISCANCKANIEGDLASEPGIEQVTVDTGTRRVRITYEQERISPGQLRARLSEIGVVVGIAALGSFFESRVVAAFHHTAAAGSLGAASTAVGKAIATGNLRAATGHVPTRIAGSIAAAGRNAFLAGLHDVLLVAAAIALTGAVAAFLLIRSRDLHVTALSAVPPEPDPEPSELP